MGPLSYGEVLVDKAVPPQDPSPLPKGARRDAVIDLGSNSLRLLIAQVDKQGRIQVLNCVKSMVRLGEGAFEKHTLQQAAMERTIAVLKTFSQTSKAYGVGKVVAVATASVREAGNGKEFTDLVRLTTGIVFNVISGPEEARLITLGVEAALPRNPCPRAFMDIGGGSTEFAVSKEKKILAAESLRVGCVRLADLFRESRDRISWEKFREIQDYVRDKAVMPFIRIKALQPVELVASSGTAAAIADLAEALGESEMHLSNGLRTVSLDEVRKVARLLCEKTESERAAIPGMNLKRLGVIVPGTAIFLTAMEELGFDRITITDRGLRDGVLLQHLENEGVIPGGKESETRLREHSVRGLAKSFSIETRHADNVADLATSLFVQARDLGYANLEPKWEELIRYASILEEAGVAISYLRHSHHSAYIVANADLLGFTMHEMQLIAATIFCGKNPGKERPAYFTLSPDEWWSASRAGVFLRIADGLDKSHRCAVTDVRLERISRGLAMHVTASSPSPIERDTLARSATFLSGLVGGDVSIDWTIDGALEGKASSVSKKKTKTGKAKKDKAKKAKTGSK